MLPQQAELHERHPLGLHQAEGGRPHGDRKQPHEERTYHHVSVAAALNIISRKPYS